MNEQFDALRRALAEFDFPDNAWTGIATQEAWDTYRDVSLPNTIRALLAERDALAAKVQTMALDYLARDGEAIELAARVERLEKDAQRLDWLEAMRYELQCQEDDSWSVVRYSEDDPFGIDIGTGMTPRAAIDAAASPQSTGETP